MLLRFVGIKDGGTVGGANVITLPVECCGVVNAEEEIQQMQNIGLLWIEDDLKRFRMPRVVLVGGVVILAAGITGIGVQYPR